MSFGYCVSDVLALIQLSWSAVEGATRACGKQDDLTKEVWSLYDVLAHVYSEMSVPESPIGYARSSLKAELESHLTGCGTQLRIINTVLDKFNALSSEQKFGKPLWPKVRFANGEDQDLANIRSRMAAYSTAITMLLRLMSLGSRGKVERQLSRQKGSLTGLRESINLALAQLNSSTRQKSLMVAYSNDSKLFWSRLRREIVKDGFSRSAINGKKNLIIAYLKELDSRGVLGYSTSFQKSMAARNDLERQSNTPASFQSSSTLTSGRDSNSSLQSFENLKDTENCSPNFDEPICVRTNSCNSSWPDSRPLTAVEHVEEPEIIPAMATAQQAGQEDEPPLTPLSYPVHNLADTIHGPKIPYDEPIDTAKGPALVHSPSPISSVMKLSRRRSRLDEVEEKVKLEDPHGREFSFPLSQVKTWEGIKGLIKKNCAGMGYGIPTARHDGTNLLPYLWEEMAEPGAKLTIRRPCAQLSDPCVPFLPTEELYLLPERPTSPEDDFSHLPTLGDWIRGGRTEFTPHSEFYEVD